MRLYAKAITALTLHFGVLLLPEYQLLDAAGPVDYINNFSQDFLRFAGLDEATIAKGPIIKWHYISSDMKPITPSSGPIQHPTCTFADCPTLDYLIVPGARAGTPLPKGGAAYLQNLIKKETFKGLLTVCGGSLTVARSGILDGLHVASNKVALKRLVEAGQLNKNVKWVGDRRWIVDGKVWSSAGITTGIDLAAEFARVNFDPELVEFVKNISEHEPLPARPDSFASILDGVSL